MVRDAPGEMTTREAAAYLSEWTDFPVSADYIYSLRSFGSAPPAEKRGRRLVFLKASLDAYLAEFGRDPLMWHSGFARDEIDRMRAMGVHSPKLEELYRLLDPDPDAIRPSDFT